MIHLKSELVVIQVENKKLRESLSKQREEWTECQRRLAELSSITKQQKQETKDVKLRKDARRIRGKHNLVINNVTASEWIDIEPDSQTEERRCGDNQEENVYGNAWTVTSDCRKRRHLKSEGRHLIDSTSWLRDEAEELTMMCHDLQARLRCIVETLDEEEVIRLKERQFDEPVS